jgi:hypothetical protein
MTAQLECKLCKTKRELTEEEISISTDIISKRNLKSDSILNIWNVFDGEMCPEGGMHEYDWNKEYYEKMLNDASKIRENNAEIVRKKNENIAMESKIDQLKKDTESKIKEMTENLEKNKQSYILMEQSNNEKKNTILKVSGREWNSWL